jgi:general secretion pathway protein M
MSATGPVRASLPPTPSGWRQQTREFWRARAPRERLILGAALLAVGAAIVWFIAVQPALVTLREAPAQIDRLDAQLQQMQRLAAESKTLQNPAQISPQQAAAALKAATDQLGEAAQLSVVGDRATLTLKGVSGPALRGWLNEARSAAHARAVEAQLVRNPQGYAGSVVLTIGAGS